MENEKRQSGEKKKKAGLIIFLIILFLVIGAAVAVIGFNAFDLRDKYLNNILRNVPIVNNLIPPEEPLEADPYAELTKEQLIADLEKANADNETLVSKNNALNTQIGELSTQLNRLTEIENRQLEYEEDKAEFDTKVALGDPVAYVDYFEAIKPERKDELYKEALQIVQLSNEEKEIYKTVVEMDESAAAKALELLVATDLETVVKILQNIPVVDRGVILSAMKAENSAIILKRMTPY